MIDLADLHLGLRGIHIGAGMLGLVAFWMAVFTKKGATPHIRCGRVFVFCSYIVGVTAVVASAWALSDSFSFGRTLGMSDEEIMRLTPARRWLFAVLGLAGMSLLSYIQLGTYAAKTKHMPNPSRYRLVLLTLVTFGFVGAGVSAMGFRSLRVNGMAMQSVIPMTLGVFAVPLAFTMLKFFRRSRPSHMDWWYKHMECMLVSGIIYHTALAITLSIRVLHQELLSGTGALIAWTLPTVIGVPVTFAWILYYKRRFNAVGEKCAESVAIPAGGDINGFPT